MDCFDELKQANEQLARLKQVIDMSASELVIANKELIFQNKEKEKRAKELLIANKELVFQNEEKEKRAAELLIANKELIFQNEEKEKRANELIIINNELKSTQEDLKEYIYGLEDMMFMTSHKVRSPVTNILGLSYILDQFIDSPEKLKQFVEHIQQSALSLDAFIKELTTLMTVLKHKGKNK